MIVIGYQGIGKSTLANKDLRFVDLESENFWVDGKRAYDWYKPYCQIAEHLSAQGYIVFTSSHEPVRNQLANSKERVICCVPDFTLKDEWIEKLRIRYEESQLEKDYKAYMNAKERFTENIREIADSGFGILWLDSMNYDLYDLVLKCVWRKDKLNFSKCANFAT